MAGGWCPVAGGKWLLDRGGECPRRLFCKVLKAGSLGLDFTAKVGWGLRPWNSWVWWSVCWCMRRFCFGWAGPAVVWGLLGPVCVAQEAKPAASSAASGAAKGTDTISVQAKLVVVPVVVHDKRALVTKLTQNDFSITVDNKPQTIRYFDKDTDTPLTVGLLVDVSRSQTSVIDDEQKASQKFLESFLMPASGSRPADKAFVMQFAHSAELLQDVTDSRPMLAAGLREIGTQAPGAGDEDRSTDASNSGNNGNGNGGNGGNNNPNSGGGNQPGNNGGYGPYGRRGGYPGGGGGNNGGGGYHGDRASGGTVLYDAIFLSSDEVLKKQTGRRALVVLTDGVDRHSKESLTEAIEAAQRADTVVYAIYYKGDNRDYGPPMHHGGYGGYNPYGYPPTTGGSTDPGTYRDPDGRKILSRICNETGGEMFELKGKGNGAIDAIYKEIGDQLRAQYRLGFTPGFEAASTGYHPLQVSLTNAADKKFEIQTRDGYYTGPAKAR